MAAGISLTEISLKYFKKKSNVHMETERKGARSWELKVSGLGERTLTKSNHAR